MKKLAIILSVLMLLFSGNVLAGQRLVCNPAPENSDSNPDNDVTKIVVIKDNIEIISPYRLVTGKNLVELVVLTGDESGVYQFSFENSQGRRSVFVNFDLQGQPDGCNGIRIEND